MHVLPWPRQAGGCPASRVVAGRRSRANVGRATSDGTHATVARCRVRDVHRVSRVTAGYASTVSVTPSISPSTPASTTRPVLTAELLSIGSELTVGDTRDTNAGDIARLLTARGVRVARIQALPDDLAAVTDAFTGALDRADLVVSTGGLGPTPDDLTREAIAACWGETPAVDPSLERWLRELWARRGMAFPEMNLKQAWLIPSATAIPNENGTAPGWWVDRSDGAVAVALPGPPREMRPMWEGWVLPRLASRGLGRAIDQRTLRLAGIGESQAADRLGAAFLASLNPQVATYARAEAVDVRIAAFDEDGRTASELANAAEAHVLSHLGDYVWARGATTWAQAIDDALAARGWALATAEAGTDGSLATLLAACSRRIRAEVHRDTDALGDTEAAAVGLGERTGADVACAVALTSRGADSAASVAVASPSGARHERRLVFLGGEQGRLRAGLSAAHMLLWQLEDRS
jgi:nicotinamide-nucleotide amidase